MCQQELYSKQIESIQHQLNRPPTYERWGLIYEIIFLDYNTFASMSKFSFFASTSTYGIKIYAKNLKLRTLLQIRHLVLIKTFDLLASIVYYINSRIIVVSIIS